MTALRLLYALALFNLAILMLDGLYNVLGGLWPLLGWE
jgi:hypothetical protein